MCCALTGDGKLQARISEHAALICERRVQGYGHQELTKERCQGSSHKGASIHTGPNVWTVTDLCQGGFTKDVSHQLWLTSGCLFFSWIFIEWSCLIVIYCLLLISFAASFSVACWCSSWFATTGCDMNVALLVKDKKKPKNDSPTAMMPNAWSKIGVLVYVTPFRNPSFSVILECLSYEMALFESLVLLL